MTIPIRHALEMHLEFFESIKGLLAHDGTLDADDFAVAAEAAGLVTILDSKNHWIDNEVAAISLASPPASSEERLRDEAQHPCKTPA